MTDPDLTMGESYRQHWSTDLHPPLYYFLVWVVRHIVKHNYVYARLVNIFPFFIFIPTFILWKKYRGIDPWIATFLTGMVSSPFFLANSVDLRSYYALTVLGACLVLALRIGRSLQGDVTKKDKWLILLTTATIFLSLNIHYSASLIYLILISAEILISIISKKYRWALLVTSVTFISGVILVCGLYVTLKTVPNFSYLNTSPTRALAFIAGGVLLSTVANFGIDIAMVLAFFRGRAGGVSAWGWSLATLGIAASALFLQALKNHGMGLNYVLDLIPLGAAFITDVAATQIFANGLLIGLMGVSALGFQALTAYHEYGNKRWMLYSDQFRDMKRACATTQFVGIDQNALPKFADHPRVSGWIGVFGEGYATVGKFSGVQFSVTSADRPTNLVVGKCPVVLLSDHEVEPVRLALPELFRESRLSIRNYRYIVTYMHDYQRVFIFYR